MEMDVPCVTDMGICRARPPVLGELHCELPWKFYNSFHTAGPRDICPCDSEIQGSQVRQLDFV